jgi:hypothetical protein
MATSSSTRPGNDVVARMLWRPASEKRQGTKSRSVVHRWYGVRYGDLAAALGLNRLDRSGCRGLFASNQG